MVETNTRTNPFVGLRPFESSESEIFFGREEQTKRLLNKLHLTNFVAVVGSSGSGKSSLVKAGLIPALKAGFLNNGDRWYFASFRPGDNPLYYFAKSLKNTFHLPISSLDFEKSIQEEGTDEIIDKVSTYIRRNESSLLILVDQFEELFTHFKNTTDQASLVYRFEFVKVILELLQSGLPIYVIITMRSDFIGKCNIFYGLPEALSNSQFLVPRLQANELIKVIESPIKLFGSKIEPRLTQKILNDLKEGDDQLPVLEHALNQLWDARRSDHLITEEDYKSIGKLDDALSKHANSIYHSLVEKQTSLGLVIEEMFKYIIDFNGEKSEGVRQPRKVREIEGVTGANLSDIQAIFDAFSIEGASFLFSPSGNRLHEDSSIDISHESLMREWDLYRKWKEEEERDKIILQRLSDFAAEYMEGKRGVLTSKELGNYGSWEKYLCFNNTTNRKKILNWANRYSIDFGKVNDYINRSKKKHLIRKFAIRFIFFIFLLGLPGLAFINYKHKADYKALSLKLQAADSKRKSEEDSSRFAQIKGDNIYLATESNAQAALFKVMSENEKLQFETLSLKNIITEKERVIKSLSDRNVNSSKILDLTVQNDKLSKDRLIAERKYAEAVLVMDSLKLELASYKKSASTKMPPTYDAKIIESEWVFAKYGSELGYDNNKKYYNVCLTIKAPPEEKNRITKVRYYLLHDSFGAGGAAGEIFADATSPQSNFEYCMTIWGTFPLKAVVYYNDEKTKSMNLNWAR